MISSEDWDCLFVDHIIEDVYIYDDTSESITIGDNSPSAYYIKTETEGTNNKAYRYLYFDVKIDNPKYDGAVVDLYIGYNVHFNIDSNWDIYFQNYNITNHELKALNWTSTVYGGSLNSDMTRLIKLVFDVTNERIHIVLSSGCLELNLTKPPYSA